MIVPVRAAGVGVKIGFGVEIAVGMTGIRVLSPAAGLGKGMDGLQAEIPNPARITTIASR
jgi:hypothetical protein